MVKLIKNGVFYKGGQFCEGTDIEKGKKGTIAYSILSAHNTSGDEKNLKIKFDALASHDITYVGILMTARAGGLEKLPLPYVLTNCHNSLCAVGGTINEDDHMFGLSAAKKYGAIYVPAHLAVIHSFMREMMSGCGKMILGSDSHTRYGALGTMAVGEGGPELVKQILGRTYDVAAPEVIAVRLTGKPRPGVGPQDVALALIGATFKEKFVKNKVLEFVGDGIKNLPIEFRNGIDVMTTETTCLSSVWMTDEETQRYFTMHGRPEAYKKLEPADGAYYDGAVEIDLSKVEPMIALPFHPSNTYTIRELCENGADILRKCEIDGEAQLGLAPGTLKLTDKIDPATGRIRVDQGVIAGCAGGTFDNLCAAADILRGKSVGADKFALSAYPASQPAFVRLIENGVAADLMKAGATLRTAFCGPCFGAGDVPANGGLSIRHSTRNFPNREGSKPGEGQFASVALMDARSIAATAANGGLLTAATELDVEYTTPDYRFDTTVYENRVWFGYDKPDASVELQMGPNIKDWPRMKALHDNLVLGTCSVIDDDVTTTDELIPSGESSSYRSNPYRLSRLTLSRRDPEYVGRADKVWAIAKKFCGEDYDAALDISAEEAEMKAAVAAVEEKIGSLEGTTGIGSLVCAVRPGDGSAREQAASCQRVLGGSANIARDYATKRYRSNLINWGMLPLTCPEMTIGKNEGTADGEILCGDWVVIPGVRKAIADGKSDVVGYLAKKDGTVYTYNFSLGALTDDERKIILAGSLTGRAVEEKNENK
ncbi:MAG: hydratase [Ruminococcaceae bacterium]|nr:hydratase [Oscillospiraceae bacterium]